MAGSPVSERISVRARFERFPATVKGAFIVRGEDPDPHQVVFREARVVSVGGRDAHEIPMGSTTLDVAPRRDVFVPFEMGVTDLDPGWYELECDLDVDGRPATFPGGKRFCVSWPRAAARRGSVELGSVLGAPASKVTIERVELAGDRATITIAADPPADPSLRLMVDGSRLPVVETVVDADSGTGTVTAYPVLRTHGSLRIDLAGGDGVDVPLP